MKLVQRLWGGEIPLFEAFWHYAIVYGLLINLVTSALFLALFVSDAPPAVLVLAFLLPLPYNFLVAVAVWRSAGRYKGPRKWADLAKAGTILWLVALTVA